MKMSAAGIETLIKPFEGCRLNAYCCPAGKLTIGWGHTSSAGAPEVVKGMSITQNQADSILSADLVRYEQAVTDLLQQPLTQHQFDVLVDFAYNAGVGALKSSTLLKKVNAGNFDAVPAELMKWTKSNGKVLPGLVRRRQAEIAWWNKDNDHVEGEQRIEPDLVPSRTMAQSKQGNAAIITASLGGFGAVKEAVQQAQDASDTANQLVGLLHNQNFLIMATVVGLGGAIWYWRKKNMDRDGA